jgi:transposase-like protein
MSIIMNNEEYLTVQEACAYLGISRQTLRVRARENGTQAFKQSISKSIYYKKADLDKLQELRPIDPFNDEDG